MGFAPIANLQKTNTMAPLRESAAGGGGGGDPSDIIAKKIIVTGDVDGGYFRSCVKNEVRKALLLLVSLTTNGYNIDFSCHVDIMILLQS
jgi:hypothetical protein